MFEHDYSLFLEAARYLFASEDDINDWAMMRAHSVEIRRARRVQRHG